VITGPMVELFSGCCVDLSNLDASQVSILDVAHSLAHICRFTGHSRKFYSVAEHSVIGSYQCEPEAAYDMLMHDVTEALIGDVSTPLKSLLPEYRLLERELTWRLSEQFRFHYPFSPLVRESDLRMLATEREQLLKPSRQQWACLENVKPYPVTLEGWPPERAKQEFIDRYLDLTFMCR